MQIADVFAPNSTITDHVAEAEPYPGTLWCVDDTRVKRFVAFSGGTTSPPLLQYLTLLQLPQQYSGHGS